MQRALTVLVVGILISVGPQASAEDRLQTILDEADERHQLLTVLRTLGSVTELLFIDTPLVDALHIVGELHRLKVGCDPVSVANGTLDELAPVNVNVSGVTVRSGLNRVLQSVSSDLTFTIRKGEIVVLPKSAAGNLMLPHVFPVHRLTGLAAVDRDSTNSQLRQLAEVISLIGTSEAGVAVNPDDGTLQMLRASLRDHERIAYMLTQLEAVETAHGIYTHDGPLKSDPFCQIATRFEQSLLPPARPAREVAPNEKEAQLRSSEATTVRVHDVTELTSGPFPTRELNDLRQELIQNTKAKAATILSYETPNARMLIVHQNHRTQEKVAELLEGMRQLKGK